MKTNTAIGAEAIEKKGWIRAYKWLILRRLSQITVLALFVFAPVWVIKGNLSSSEFLNIIPMTDPLMFLQVLASGMAGITQETIIGTVIIVLFYALAGGRVFCSWVCPVNIVTDAADWLSRALGIKGRSTRFSRNLRYWILAMVLILSAVTGSLAYELVNPVSILHRGLFFGMGLGWFSVLAVFLFDLFMSKRGWCSHLCPMGALYGLIGSRSLLRVRADARDKCDDCAECFVVCPEPQILPPILKGLENGIPPVVADSVCTNCGRCIDVCAEDVFEFGFRQRPFNLINLANRVDKAVDSLP